MLSREVSAGQVVKAGDVLYVLSPKSANQSAQAIAKNLTAGQQSLQATAEHQRQGLKRELGLLKAEAGLQQERQALADAALARFEQFSRDQFISPAQVQVQAKLAEVLGQGAQSEPLYRITVALARQTVNAISRHFNGVALELRPCDHFAPPKKTAAPGQRWRQLFGRICGLKRSLLHILGLALALNTCFLLSPFLLQGVVDGALVSADRDFLVTLGQGFGLPVLLQVAVGALRSWAVL